MESLSRHAVEFYPLTSLHVGGGVTLEPYEYIVRGGEILRLNLRALMKRMPTDARDKFIEAMASNLEAAVALIEQHLDESVIRNRMPSAPGFEEYWRHRLSTSVETLALTLFPETMTGTGGYYLPGSSLKGSIRTAYYAVLGQQTNFPVEWEVFGHKRYPLDASPFKRMKVSDIDLGRNVEVSPVYSLKIADWTSGAPEVVKLLVRGNLDRMPAEEVRFDDLSRLPVRFEGSIAFFDGYPGQEVVSIQSLIAHTKTFCAAQIQYEMDKPNIGPFYQWLFQAIGPAMQRPDTTLVRVGFGGGRLATSVLAMGAEGVDAIAQELTKVKFALSRDPHPKIRKIAGSHPMGWALMRFSQAVK